MSMKKVLLIGGTGVMGSFLSQELLNMGYAVDVISLDEKESGDPALRYFRGNAMDDAFRAPFLSAGYDCIVDFLIYGTELFRQKHAALLKSTGHYIYLSSYRVYADEEHPIRETSPRFIDCCRDEEFMASDDYSLHKARGEETLKASGMTNWTSVRPAITYSSQRFQLVTLEGDTLINRTRQGKRVPVPEEALNVQATMTFGGDVAKMIARLVCNPAAMGEAYTVSTSEHHSWGEIAEMYRDLIGISYVSIPKEEYLKIFSDDDNRKFRWQLEYDRLCNRIVDNSKILAATGMKQSELLPLYDGLKQELSKIPKDKVFVHADYGDLPRRMDLWFENHGL